MTVGARPRNGVTNKNLKNRQDIGGLFFVLVVLSVLRAWIQSYFAVY